MIKCLIDNKSSETTFMEVLNSNQSKSIFLYNRKNANLNLAVG